MPGLLQPLGETNTTPSDLTVRWVTGSRPSSPHTRHEVLNRHIAWYKKSNPVSGRTPCCQTSLSSMGVATGKPPHLPLRSHPQQTLIAH